MTCNAPLNQRVKAFCAFIAALTGASLIVFAAMALRYNSELNSNELRYQQLQQRLATEQALSRQDVQTIILRLDTLEEGLNELKTKEK